MKSKVSLADWHFGGYVWCFLDSRLRGNDDTRGVSQSTSYLNTHLHISLVFANILLYSYPFFIMNKIPSPVDAGVAKNLSEGVRAARAALAQATELVSGVEEQAQALQGQNAELAAGNMKTAKELLRPLRERGVRAYLKGRQTRQLGTKLGEVYAGRTAHPDLNELRQAARAANIIRPNDPNILRFDEAKEMLRKGWFFGPEEWKKVFGFDFPAEYIPELPGSLRAVLQESDPWIAGKLVGQTHQLCLRPRHLDPNNGQNDPLTVWRWRNLSTRMLGDYRGAKMYGKDAESWYRDPNKEVWAHTPAAETEWILMPEKFLPNSPGKTIARGDEILRGFPDYTDPTVLDELTKLMTVYGMTEQRINENMYAWCKDKTSDGNRACVGSFDRDGASLGRCLPAGSDGYLARALRRRTSVN